MAVIGIVKAKSDNRIAIVPSSLPKLNEMGATVWVEQGAGMNSYYPDSDYEGAEIASREEILAKADIIISTIPLEKVEYSKTKSKALLISLFAPYFDDSYTRELVAMDKDIISMDMIPRTTLAQSMDILSSMASIAGYKSVIEACQLLPSYFPMMMTAAGTIRPTKILILGAGVAGLQAIATARRLGAVVEAFDPRLAAKEEVLSLGAKFVEVEGGTDAQDEGGYAKEQSEEYLRKQRELVQEKAAKANVIITTAQVRGRKAPLLVPKSTVENMQPGSVIVDLAASTGGNCELTQDGKTIDHNGIKIVGNSNLSDEMPKDASFLYSNNLINFLKLIIREGEIVYDAENEIVTSAWISRSNTE